MCSLEKRGRVFLLTLTGDDDHRLGPARIESLGAALQQIRADAAPGSALVVTAQGNFFSNGFDLKWAQAGGSAYLERGHHMASTFAKQVMAELFSLPMPTIAAVTGHAVAAGFFFVLCHDYVFMRKDKGFLYLSELDIGITFTEPYAAMLRSKIASPAVKRLVALRAAKMKAAEAVEMGIIDGAHDSPEETLAAAMRLAEELAERKWNGKIYAEIRKATFPEASTGFGSLGKEEPQEFSRL